jgi:hypothetical protein
MPMPQTSPPDSATRVIPAAASRAPWRVVEVAAEVGDRLFVRFVDGTAGHVDMHAFLRSPAVDATPFAPLREATAFAQAAAIEGSIRWPNGADLAPAAMYDAIRATGLWNVPEFIG